MLMQDIDALPSGPAWSICEITIHETGQKTQRSYLFMRNIIDVVHALMADPSFEHEMRYAPVRIWTTQERTSRVYSNPWTGDWWWRMQICLPDKMATIIPIFIASDRTQLSIMSGGQQAYPVYVTIGNIDKSVRRKSTRKATALLAYLPVDDFDHASSPSEKARLKNELTHRAMEKITEPLRTASKEGVEMLCADGRTRRAYPIVAGIIGDWPELCAMACTCESVCPKCWQKQKGRGGFGRPAPPRRGQETLAALREYFEYRNLAKLTELGIKPWWPWWAGLPYVNFHASIMPDLLHQLHQGMVRRHIMFWSITQVGKRRLDAHFMSMPQAHGMRFFSGGISKVNGHWTGRESREVAKQILPMVAGEDSYQVNPDVARVVRTILEFTYRAHASRMTEEDVDQLDLALQEFHQFKNVLIREGIYESDVRFDKIAKLHQMLHYPAAICEMGTPDNYSTESPEHLHIECAKRPFRASNKVRPMPQMVRFMERYEAIRMHRSRMNTYLGQTDTAGGEREPRRSRVIYEEDGEGDSADSGFGDAGDNDDHTRARPSGGRMLGIDIVAKHEATDLLRTLHSYLRNHATRQNLPTAFLPTLHHRYDVWRRLYLHHQPLPFDPEHSQRDVIRAHPASQYNDAHFDVVLILTRPSEDGIYCYYAARVRAIFGLPKSFHYLCSHPLVYVELFNPFARSVAPSNRLYTVSHALTPEKKRQTAVYSIYDLAVACHLAPITRRLDASIRLRSRPDLLDTSTHFFFNHFYNHYIFRLVEHWRMAERAGREEQETD
ncbi:hypothetical protein BDV93DRAFT_482428 [Ceratobasidium sp. AG-I]|nr:hypothetical protein BDV93DRAFT_482428 [Ceratobasidium sp. AG-I]